MTAEASNFKPLEQPCLQKRFKSKAKLMQMKWYSFPRRIYGWVAELADATDLKSVILYGCVGSTPIPATLTRCSSVGRMLGLGPRDRPFESDYFDLYCFMV